MLSFTQNKVAPASPQPKPKPESEAAPVSPTEQAPAKPNPTQTVAPPATVAGKAPTAPSAVASPKGQATVSDRAASVIDVLKKGNWATFQNEIKRLQIKVPDKKIPTIIVVGNEKHGKSMALNRLAYGYYFPMDTKRCTRMPVRLKLINAPDGTPTTCRVTTPAVKGQPSRVIPVDAIHSAKQIAALMSELAGDGFLREELVLEVCSPNVPTLELLDLPGLVDHPQEARTMTYALTEEYMKKPENLILCTVVANVEQLVGSQAMGLIWKLDKENDPITRQPYDTCHRTIALLTKCDKAGEAYSEVTEDRIMMKDETRGLMGVVALKSPDTRGADPVDVIHDFNAQLREEQEWFGKHYPKLRKDTHVSVEALALSLDKFFGKFIIDQWVPLTKRDMDAKIAEVDGQLTALGLAVLNRPQPASQAIELIESVTKELKIRMDTALKNELEKERDPGTPKGNNFTRNAVRELLHERLVDMISEVKAALETVAKALGAYMAPDDVIKLYLKHNMRPPTNQEPSLVHRYPNLLLWMLKRTDDLFGHALDKVKARARSLIDRIIDEALYTPLDVPRLSRAVRGILIDGLGLDVIAALTSELAAVYADPLTMLQDKTKEGVPYLLEEHKEFVEKRQNLLAQRKSIEHGKAVLMEMRVPGTKVGTPAA